jgi:hypothetical protein
VPSSPPHVPAALLFRARQAGRFHFHDSKQIWDFLQFSFQWNKRGAEPQKPYVTVGHEELKLPANFGNPGDRHLMTLASVAKPENLHDKLWLIPLCRLPKILYHQLHFAQGPIELIR